MSIYADIILDHYHNPRNNTSLDNPTAFVDVSNPLCGDKFHMEVVEKGGVVQNIGFTGQGCAISIASVSMLSEYAKGKKTSELVALSKDDVLGLLGIALTPIRMKCALLGWEGLILLMKNEE